MTTLGVYQKLPWDPTSIQMENWGLYGSTTVLTWYFGVKWIVLKVPTIIMVSGKCISHFTIEASSSPELKEPLIFDAGHGQRPSEKGLSLDMIE